MDHGSKSTWDRHRVLRLARLAALGILVFLVVDLGPPWLHALISEWLLKRIIVRLLLTAQVTYGVVLATVPVALIALTVALLRARRRGTQRTWLVRGFALCLAVLFALGTAEAVAAAWLAWTQIPTPWLPTRFPDRPTRIGERLGTNARAPGPLPSDFSDSEDNDTLDIIVLGGSSACGAPYHKWLSLGQIVAWKLHEAIPDRRFRVEILARMGYTLELAHKLMSGLKRRPDLVILYSGHNEFDWHYNWGHTPLHYVDDTPPARVPVERSARRHSPLCQLIQQTIGIYRNALPPPHRITRPLVDVPVYTTAEYEGRLCDFRTRLEAIVSYCERLGALVVLLPPPGNDADFEPNRSFLSPQTTRPERAQFARDFVTARQIEEADPVQGIAAYRALLARQPGFAEAHYQLARVLEAAGHGDEANQHYVAARDCDGFPVRCPSDFLNAYHEIAARHPRSILVDAPEVLRKLSPRGTVGDEFIADGHHPSLIGYAALSQAILQALYARQAFDWPTSSPAPVVTPSGCAAHFEMNSEKWVVACHYLESFYEMTAHIRFDPSQRLARVGRYEEAIRRLENGTSPETIRVPGVGTGGLPAPSHTAARIPTSGHD
jgi:hypothetical protein